MGAKKMFSNFMFADSEEEDVLELNEDEASVLNEYESPKSKMGDALKANAKLVLFEPRSYVESQEIAEKLKEGRAVVVNLHKLQKEYSQRAVDFLSGAAFALDGKILKIGPEVFICTPKTMPVTGNISEDGNQD